jgi:2-oxoisovalerate dehydrogenase E1 component alpha subunit
VVEMTVDDEMVRVLGPDGTLAPGADPVDPADLLALHRDMVLVRRLDTEAIALQRQGEMGLWTSLRGQEAAQIGAARALAAQDMVFPSYREHGVAWCRGLEPTALVNVWRGSEPGGWDPHTHNVAPYTIVIGAQTLHAAGYAMGVVRDGLVGTGDPERDMAVIVFLGDGAMSQGDVSEAFVWAATQALPVVFFCQNNQWAISAPSTIQSTVPLHRRAAGFGFPGVRVDGNDVLACRSVTAEALARARSGGGPTLVEAFTYRMNPHTTSDDTRRYREPAEEARWRELDPITRVRAYLDAAGVDPARFAEVEEEADKFGARFRADVRAISDVTMGDVFDRVHVTPTPELLDQRADATSWTAG